MTEPHGPYRICPRQDLAIQIDRLKQAGCDVIHSETGSGATRHELATVLEFLRAGDVLVMHRLGRSTRAVLNLLHALAVKSSTSGCRKPTSADQSVQPTGGRPSSVANSP
ncbi:recombinase family protein [Oceaniovalibus sp. ACAM 378]|uniref:recombinase family protein n=1 Tax=Oceaniovalibus sp. ACAM 378 TaxID=2599923 RepID=UPI0021076052|nr:recombinase family protein [Oceaniovalibus sp. ACAM 378]